jgi:hypothetical protein
MLMQSAFQRPRDPRASQREQQEQNNFGRRAPVFVQ